MTVFEEGVCACTDSVSRARVAKEETAASAAAMNRYYCSLLYILTLETSYSF